MKLIYFALFVRNVSDHRNVTEQNSSKEFFTAIKRPDNQNNQIIQFLSKKSSVFVLNLKANVTRNKWS